jgi:uncharacterized repeat protein (TIGR03803 family)
MSRTKSLRTLGVSLVVFTLVFVGVPGAQAQSEYKTLHRFTGVKGGYSPLAGLIFDQAGNLYSTTYLGGSEDHGAVFQLTPDSDGKWTENVLYSFCSLKNCVDGSIPTAGLVFDAAGNLYGTTSLGQADIGVAFKLSPNQDGSWTERVLHNFSGEGGTEPNGLIFDNSGNLYGTAANGGSHGEGTVFELTPGANDQWTYKVLYNFGATGSGDGEIPYANLIFDLAGNLYGTTILGGVSNGGTVFKLTPNSDGSWTESVLHSFCSLANCRDGWHLQAGLIFDQAGNLYGAAALGGTDDCGVVFELTLDSSGHWEESVLHDFTGRDGDSPDASLVFDAAGNLYSTTNFGGNLSACNGGCGVVFEMSQSADGTWKEKVLHAFLDHPGAIPNADLIFDAKGNLYGTTLGYSFKTEGSVFEITP